MTLNLKELLTKDILHQILEERPDLNPYPRAGRKKGEDRTRKDITIEPEDLTDIKLTRGQMKQIISKKKKPNNITDEERERRNKVLAEGRAKMIANREQKKKLKELEAVDAPPAIKKKEKSVPEGSIKLQVKPPIKKREKKKVDSEDEDEEQARDEPTETDETTDVEFKKVRRRIERRKKMLQEIDDTIQPDVKQQVSRGKYDSLFSKWN